ncbi:AAA family ATPase [Microbacterium lacticum]
MTVTGPAGTGKTTMLRTAFAALRSQKRRMLVVAPTRKGQVPWCGVTPVVPCGGWRVRR